MPTQLLIAFWWNSIGAKNNKWKKSILKIFYKKIALDCEWRGPHSGCSKKNLLTLTADRRPHPDIFLRLPYKTAGNVAINLPEHLHFSAHQLARQLDKVNRRTLCHWRPLFSSTLDVGCRLLLHEKIKKKTVWNTFVYSFSDPLEPNTIIGFPIKLLKIGAINNCALIYWISIHVNVGFSYGKCNFLQRNFSFLVTLRCENMPFAWKNHSGEERWRIETKKYATNFIGIAVLH